MPTLFVISYKVIGNVQMATFAAFGSFATLVLATFGGGWRDKLIAHAGLAVAGSVLLTIGTLVSHSTLLAALVTVPVAFLVFFAGVIGPNVASGAIAALLPYVLPAASPGTAAMIPDRLAGWWLASVVGTAAVLLLSPPSPGDKLKRAAAKLASALVSELEAMLRGDASDEQLAGAIQARHELRTQFTATPYRPTGLGAADQAMANAVELLEWCTSLIVDSVRERSDLSGAPPDERELLEVAANVLRDSGTLLGGGDARPDLERLEQCRVRSIARLHLKPQTQEGHVVEEAQLSFHAHAIAVTILAIGADSVVAAGVADPAQVAEEGRRWLRASTFNPPERRLEEASQVAGYALRHASVRSVWFVNSLRAALAIAAAVAVADLTSVQHGFWVVLGTLSVLRTNAGSTGSTALRALLGTVAGFAIGAVLIIAIGTDSTALWVALPIAVFVAAYAPGTAPFAVGQAAFTVTVSILFNLLAPVGWKVGVLRIEDVALGCMVSVVVGLLFWPRGVASVVGDDLADAYRAGASYLTEAVEWVSGLPARAPDAARAAAVTAGFRVDDALRGLLAEQGTKHIRKEDLWRLVGGSMRLRLTAHAVVGLPRVQASSASPAALNERTTALESWYHSLASQLDRPRGRAIATLQAPALAEYTSASSPRAVWLCEHLSHLSGHLGELVVPARRVAEARRRPWWR
jgi:uncharacterized membrane protein YccC